MAEDIMVAIVDSFNSSTSIATILQNAPVGVSILHVALALQCKNKREIVKYLIAGGADCDQRDESGLTACECALKFMGDRDLATQMITAELMKLSDERAFYVIIRRGSLDVFKLFLEVKNYKENEIFQGISNAMIELNVKRAVIEEKLEVFLQYRLVFYAHSNLSGDSASPKDPIEWQTHFEVITKYWKVLKRDYGDRDYSKIDNEFLHRIQVIHNQMFFVKDKRFLKHLPMMEMTFCLAIFVSIFKWGSEYHLFQFMINKLNIMQFLEVICRQLESIQKDLDSLSHQLKATLVMSPKGSIPTKEHLLINWSKINPSRKLGENIFNRIISGLRKKLDSQTAIDEVIASESFDLTTKLNASDRSVLRRLGRCYFRTKQLYSIQKCLYHVEVISSYGTSTHNKLLTTLAVKRVIQVIGESIKSTKNSPNIPKKVESVLVQMLTNFFPETNKYFREFFSHKYSLAKLFLFGPAESNVYDAIANRIGYVDMIFSIVFICSLLEASRSLLGCMRRCQNLGQLRSLLQYVTNLNLPQLGQIQHFEKIQKIFSQMYTSLTTTKVGSPHEQRSMNHLQQDFKRKTKILEHLQGCMVSKWAISFEDIKSACLANADIATIHCMIDWNLTFDGQNDIYEEIQMQWLTNHVIVGSLEAVNTELLDLNPSLMSGLLINIERKLTAIEEEEYVACTRRSLQELGIDDPSNEVVSSLHKQLVKYYENVFFLDNKYKAIRQIFKAQKKLSINEELFKQVRRNDEKSLQEIFDNRINDMREMLKLSGILIADDLIDNINRISPQILMALEYCQLELCEMLITNGYFGDNFHLAKHRIPLIHGRNFRNYLAHDSLSYNILTDSSRIKILVNAVAMINTPIDLFNKKSKVVPANVCFPSTEQALEWVENQMHLANSIREANWGVTQKSIGLGADLLGVYCGTIGPMQPLNSSITIIELINPNTLEEALGPIWKLCETQFPTCSKKLQSIAYRSWHSLQQEMYDEAFRLLKMIKPVKNSTLPQEFFFWELIIDYLLTEMEDWEEKDAFGRTVLHRLIKAGNFERVELLLELMPETDVNATDRKGSSPLDYALEHGCFRIAQLLLRKHATVSVSNQQLALICHANEFVPQLFGDFDKDMLNNQTYALTAIRSNNLNALNHLVDRFYYGSHAFLKDEHLPSCLSLAAFTDRPRILEYIINLPTVNFFRIDKLPNGNTALQHALRKQNYSMVKLLLEHGASVNLVHPDGRQRLRTAFQLAVNANSCKLVKLMKNVDRQQYLGQIELQHPMAVAVGNGSSKMVRCLREFGFSLLDTGRVLQDAVQHDRTQFVEQIFYELDAAGNEWGSLKDSTLATVGSLLSHWRALAYLEEPTKNGATTILRAVDGKNSKLLEKLLDKSKTFRRFQGSFLRTIEWYEKEKFFESFNCNDMTKKRSLLALCDKLMCCVKGCSKSNSFHSKIQITFEGSLNSIVVNGSLTRFYEEDSTSKVSFPNIVEVIKSVNPLNDIIHQSFEAVIKHLQNENCLICGTIQPSADGPKHYFMKWDNFSYLFALSSVEQQFPLKPFINFGDSTGETPLHLACSGKNNLEEMELLLANGANALAMNSVRQTPLHLALIGPDKEKALLLLNYCIDHDLKSPEGTRAVELPNCQGHRPIHIAAMGGKTKVLALLIDHNVSLRAKDQLGCTAAVYAAASTQVTSLKMLLDHDPELVSIADNQGETMLHQSARRNDPAVLNLILERDVDFFALDDKGASAVQNAIVEKNMVWLEKVLVHARAKRLTGLTCSLAKQGVPAINFLVFYNDAKLLKLIVEYEIGDDLKEDLSSCSLQKLRDVLTSRTDDEGYTPLHIAVRLRFSNSLEYILYCQTIYNSCTEQKLNLASEEVDLDGKSPLDYALASNDELLINALLNAIS